MGNNNAPKKKSISKRPVKKFSKKNVPTNAHSEERIELIRCEYVRGQKREDICKKFKITYKTLDNLVQRRGWTKVREEIVGKVREEFAVQIVTDKVAALARLNREATEYLDLLRKKLFDSTTSNVEISLLLKSRNLITRELLRSLGLVDTIRQDSPTGEEKSQVNIQIIQGVGEHPGVIEKLIGGRVMSVEETSSKDQSNKR
ncbi:hypothetical protein [Leptospira santarosai]|uniref:hypothetical protein n=1 Tax=Leptospira santarosai TaxID=28183 RepID=UPI00029736DF|nr:hypothetical protein [Leptospira santarosai]EKS06925.1 hypothetical protein LEP1GSC071_1663 [Leptospira santarosai str. JET]MDI7165359.1 hypothetical protein [Leptospira santarosai]MDI7182840.1 hypothetical protein [Leptospira santarosai]MDO6383335.1 hypothetical protein [Leptospira santarosai]